MTFFDAILINEKENIKKGKEVRIFRLGIPDWYSGMPVVLVWFRHWISPFSVN
jgi:hypothetical protein